MYITINDIIGEKRIDLSYPIKNFDSSKEVPVSGILSNNIQYKITKSQIIIGSISPGNKKTGFKWNLYK